MTNGKFSNLPLLSFSHYAVKAFLASLVWVCTYTNYYFSKTHGFKYCQLCQSLIVQSEPKGMSARHIFLKDMLITGRRKTPQNILALHFHSFEIVPDCSDTMTSQTMYTKFILSFQCWLKKTSIFKHLFNRHSKVCIHELNNLSKLHAPTKETWYKLQRKNWVEELHNLFDWIGHCTEYTNLIRWHSTFIPIWIKNSCFHVTLIGTDTMI